MHLIVGLGNPGRQYKQNRHNVGFLTLDRLASRFNETFSRMETKSLVLKIKHEGVQLILAKPQTFMNLSGGAVSSLVRFYKINLENILIVYDDVDLPPEVIRLRPGGGSGGHKGMRSIIDNLGEQDFSRLRIGVGRPPGRMDPADFLLQDFSEEELEAMGEVCDWAVQAVECWLTDGIDIAMTRFNRDSLDKDV